MTLIDGESNDSSKWDTRDNEQDNRLNSFHAVWDAASTPGSVLILSMSPFIIVLLSSSVWKFPQQRPARGQLLHPRASELDREGKGRQTGLAPQIGQRPSRDF